MARAIKVHASMKYSKGEWNADEMMKVSEEADKEAEHLNSEHRASEQELGNSSRPNLAS